MSVLFWMIVFHFICDYALQGDWMSKAKHPDFVLTPKGLVRWKDMTDTQIFDDTEYREVIWPHVLAGHALIHAGAVQFATGSWILAGCEFVAHFVIDYAKCKGRFGYGTDQALHFFCKITWFALFFWWHPV